MNWTVSEIQISKPLAIVTIKDGGPSSIDNAMFSLEASNGSRVLGMVPLQCYTNVFVCMSVTSLPQDNKIC
jgi:hypothetical protein